MTNKLTASPDVFQMCHELLNESQVQGLNIFLQGFSAGLFLTLAICFACVLPFLVDAVDIYAPKRYRDFLRSRREMRLDRKIKRLEKLQQSSEVQS